MKANANLSKLEDTIFYTMEKAIKTYRQFAQRNIKNHQIDITIDQWLVLKTLKDHPGITQKAIAQKVFKDYASIARIIELLVKKGYLLRAFHEVDRRRYDLQLTPVGEKIYKKLIPIISSNRSIALGDLATQDISMLSNFLQEITNNCAAHMAAQ